MQIQALNESVVTPGYAVLSLQTEAGAQREATLGEVCVTRFCAAFNQPELRLRQVEIGADPLRSLLFEVETAEHFAVALGEAAQHAHRDRRILRLDREAVGIECPISDRSRGI